VFRRYIVFVFILAAIGMVCGGNAQSNGRTQKESKWIEGKFLVRVQKPFLSDAGYVVLSYTVTNNSGADVEIDFLDEHTPDAVPHKPARVFIKLRSSESYAQVTPKDDRIYFPKKLLPADLPVDFKIVVGARHDTSTSWLSSKTEAEKERDAIRDELENLESIAVFIPDRRLKIEFPIRK
jgi:hypothetical protein